MNSNLLYSTPCAESLIERAGRVCFRSHDKTTETSAIPFIRGILARGHESVIEHSRYVFELEGPGAAEKVLAILDASPYIRHSARGFEHFLLSGNARAWRRAWPALTNPMKDKLSDGWGVLFDGPTLPNKGYHHNIDATDNVELWALHTPNGLSRDEMLRHGAATVYLSRVSRVLTHQLVRHRAFSFSQASQRYCDEGHWDYYTPDSYQAADRDFYETHISGARYGHKHMGGPREDSRYLLPQAVHSEIVVTGTFEGWQNFFALRCDKHAQAEIRNVAEQIRGLLAERVPEVIG